MALRIFGIDLGTASVKVAGSPWRTVVLDGWVVMEGPASTVSVAAPEVADPTELVNTAWYWSPFSPPVVVRV